MNFNILRSHLFLRISNFIECFITLLNAILFFLCFCASLPFVMRLCFFIHVIIFKNFYFLFL